MTEWLSSANSERTCSVNIKLCGITWAVIIRQGRPHIAGSQRSRGHAPSCYMLGYCRGRGDSLYVNRLAPLGVPDGVTSVVWSSIWYWSRTPTVVINIIRGLNLKISSINPQYRLLMFTNTESLSKTNHNLTFRMAKDSAPKSCSVRHQILMDFTHFIFTR